ncbi:hypothetical protein GCM10010405_34160 [Streptomyces macrosporus]|uniref:Transposase n=1 Tax=Streptomyces macrosporus TaxID=44032 RepID=A0ABN3K3P2_9ACTN
MPGGWHDPGVAITVNRAVSTHRLFTGISRRHLAGMVEESAVPWQAGLEGRRHAARGGVGKRAAGAGARHQPVCIDRPAATLIHLRHDLPHAVPGLLFGSTAPPSPARSERCVRSRPSGDARSPTVLACACGH